MEDLFDIDSVDITSLESTEDSTEIEAVPTEEEYWKFPKDALASFLQLASQFSWRSGRDLTSKSVSLSTSEDRTQLICRATDFDSYLSVKIPLQSPNPISTTVIFPTSTLLKCIPQCPKTMVLKKDAFLVMGQWVGIESIILDPTLFINSDPIDQKGDIHLPSISSIIPIASSATVPRDRNIRFYTDSIQSTCLWTELRIPFTSPVDFLLSAREATLLKSLGKDLSLGVTHSDIPRLVLQTPTITLWILYREPESKDSAPVLPDWSIQVEQSSLSQLVSLSESLPSSTGLLQFQYTQEQGFVVTYTSKLSNNPFTLPVEVNGSPEPLSPSMVQTKILKLYLKSLTEKVLDISWDSSTLFFRIPQCTVALKWEAQ